MIHNFINPAHPKACHSERSAAERRISLWIVGKSNQRCFSLPLPARPGFCIFQDDAVFCQVLADSIARGEVAAVAGQLARRNPLLDLLVTDRLDQRALSVVAQPAYDIGVAAAQLLLARIADGDRPPTTTTLGARLITRGSSLRLA